MSTAALHYNRATGELKGERVCRYCGTLSRILPEYTTPDFHTVARCVEMEEPAGR